MLLSRLEAAVVYLPNLIKDQFPPRKPPSMVAPVIDEAGGEKEEGEDCLFFVALSRAHVWAAAASAACRDR